MNFSKNFLLVLLSFITLNTYSQCSINKSRISDDRIVYEANYERIYANDDLENGVQAFYLKLAVLQNTLDVNKLKFSIYVNSAKKGSKNLVVPRHIKITYRDGKTLSLDSEELGSIKSQNGFYTQQASFRVFSAIFNDLQTKSISDIEISDTRTGEKLKGHPFPNLVKEQANCIGSKLE